jgi:carboxypeptidase Q
VQKAFGFRNAVRLAAVVLAALVVVPLAAQMQQSDAVDLNAMYKIKQEALGNSSQVMKTLSFLTDVYGGRLTGSTNVQKAGDWTVGQLKDWGIDNPHLEYWDFGRGWVNERFYVNVTAPVTYPLIAYPLAWTPGTKGPVTAEVVVIPPVTSDADLDKLKGTLKGKIVMLDAPREIQMSTEPLAHRYTEAELAELSQQTIPGAGRGGAPPAFNQLSPQMQAAAAQMQAQLRAKLNLMMLDEGVVAVFQSSRGDGGTVFVQSAGTVTPQPTPAPAGGRGGRGTPIYARSTPTPMALNQIALAAEHYNRLYRTIHDDNVPVTVELNIQNKFLDNDGKSFDVIGEIPGSDPKLADQVVMIGGHFDSWHSGTGATDNGVGSAVMLEVMRVLKATGLKMGRTVRIGLWTGEEEGLLGSRAYVTNHFGAVNPDTRAVDVKPEQAKFDVYFNIDNGSGKLRGIYTQGNDAATPIFRTWMRPFEAMGMTTVSPNNTGGTDHQSFDAVGLPGFQFIQDPLEYDSRTHHSNMDVWDRVQQADLKQMVAVVSTFVYQAANREQMFPRKPLPTPGAGGRGGRRGGN